MNDGRKLTLAAALAALVGPASGQDVRVVRQIPNAKCMELALTHEHMMDPGIEVPIRGSPDTSAPEIGLAGGTMIVKDPAVPRNGFLEVMMPNGRVGWMETRWLKHSKPDPRTGRTCTPVVMSNGRMGFASR